ncbi:hypothetical protein [Polyangium sp. 15x6]|uniref:hypothetical protein n=1 Tax=Polyangium sp. 15x6 TaxID=3042687 RepID=UPI00249B3513|nr:hypothetical protein [Polyangium sp. 15x6]MDI3289043.1 hypothetical protein [Polyangium sp. 15x6]
MHRLLVVSPLLAFVAGCDGVTYWNPPEVPPSAPLTVEEYVVLREHEDTIERVVNMTGDLALQERVAARGLRLVDVAWEDTGRAVGSSLGPNISDLTLEIRRRRTTGEWADALMPVVRYPNFSDRTADVPSDRFFLRVGNERGAPLHTISLLDALHDLRKIVSSPESLTGVDDTRTPLDLSAPRDSHFLVSAQAVFLPIPRLGQATFHPVVFNYQSAPGSPAVLVLLATREGTSVKVIENRSEDRSVQGYGQELYFNENGSRAAFTAERRSDVAARIESRGGPRTESEQSALGRGADLLALIQVPLVHEHRGALGGLSSSDEGYGYEFSDDPLAAGGFGPNDATIRVRPGPVRSDLERAVLGHGPRLGPFLEGHGGPLVRDERFPIRITVQFYKATSDGVVTDADLDAIARNIGSAYAHADFVGSLVLPPGDPNRPTAWQTMPGEWFPW